MGYPEKKKRNDAIVEKYKQGWGYKKIASYFGLHFTTVHKIIRRRGATKGQASTIDKG